MSLLHFTSPKLLPHPLASLRRASSSSHRPFPTAAAASIIPARDRIIDFGKHRGRMLGSLPSSYLSWISNNLRAGDFLRWARLADEVLADPIYRDRIEWESAERLLAGPAGRRRSSDSPVADLLSVSEAFGWDNDDKEGWERLDFGLLGTSMGGRIPRRRSSGMGKGEVFSEGEKEKRRRMRMEKLREEVGDLGEGEEESGDGVFGERKKDLGDEGVGRFVNRFPGRGALLEKIKRRGA